MMYSNDWMINKINKAGQCIQYTWSCEQYNVIQI